MSENGFAVVVKRVRNGFVYYRTSLSTDINLDTSDVHVSGNDVSEIGKTVMTMFGRSQNPKTEGGE